MTVSFSTLDLNLLRVFDAVMEERSVLRASQKVCLSQSAVSHSLARLREMLDDELFIRTTTGMQPTARAVAMAGMVRDALKSLEAAIELPRFDPATSTRKFTIAANDFTTMVLAPRLLQMLKAEAPHVDLAIKPVTRIDLAEQIDLGRIDAAIGTFQAPSRFKSGFLFEYDDVLITHASQRLGVVTAEMLSGIPIIVVSFGGEQEGAVEGFISERGLARRSEMYDRASFERAMSASKQAPRIAISLPHFLALPALPGRFRNVGDRSSPARRCLRPHQPDFDPRTSLPHHPSGGPLALARAPRRRRLAGLAARCHAAVDRALCAPVPRRSAIDL